MTDQVLDHICNYSWDTWCHPQTHHTTCCISVCLVTPGEATTGFRLYEDQIKGVGAEIQTRISSILWLFFATTGLSCMKIGSDVLGQKYRLEFRVYSWFFFATTGLSCIKIGSDVWGQKYRLEFRVYSDCFFFFHKKFRLHENQIRCVEAEIQTLIVFCHNRFRLYENRIRCVRAEMQTRI